MNDASKKDYDLFISDIYSLFKKLSITYGLVPRLDVITKIFRVVTKFTKIYNSFLKCSKKKVVYTRFISSIEGSLDRVKDQIREKMVMKMEIDDEYTKMLKCINLVRLIKLDLKKNITN